jgi:hypothetical protein
VSKEWLIGLWGFGKRKAKPAIVRIVRTVCIGALTIAVGAVSIELEAIDWEEYGIIGTMVNSLWQLVLEALPDQYKKQS